MRRYLKSLLVLFIVASLGSPLMADAKKAAPIVTDDNKTATFAANDKKNNGVAKFTFGKHRWVTLHYLLQVQGYSENVYDSSAGETEGNEVWSRGFEIRRSRLILKGQVAKNISFFMQTDDIRVGNQGPGEQYDSDTALKDKKGVYTQDAFINYKVADELQDLKLQGNIQRCCGLICYQKGGVAADGHGDHGALFHAS